MSAAKLFATLDRFTTLRLRAFRLVTALIALVFLAVAGGEFINAWILRDPVEDIHLWHIAELNALLIILLGGVLVSLWRRPLARPMLTQFVILSLTILATGVAPFNPPAAAVLLIVFLLIVTYPNPRALLDFRRDHRISILLLVLTILLALFLAPVAINEIHLQIIGMTQNDVHALAPRWHWIGSALMMVLLVIAGLMTSTRRPGWVQLGVITGLTYCFLGVIAMIVPLYAGSWGYTGGMFSIIAGLWYIVLTLTEAYVLRDTLKTRQQASRSALLAESLSEALPARETHASV